jgi:clan AA aspartic protease
MGLVHVEIRLDNPKEPSGNAVSTQALVDTGALHLCIPEALSRQLNLVAERVRRVTFADGRSVEAPYVGPVRVEAIGRTCFVEAMVFGDEVLLGAIPMDDLDVLIDPARQQLVPRNPRGPVPMANVLAPKTPFSPISV